MFFSHINIDIVNLAYFSHDFSRKFCCKFGIFFPHVNFVVNLVFFPDINFDVVNLAFLIHYDYEVLIHYSDK